MRLPIAVLVCLSLALGAVLAGCGGDDKKSNGPPATTAAGASGPTLVSMRNSKFVPDHITVAVGQKITWMNDDGYAHNVTATSDEKISSGNLDGGATFEFTPTKAGTINYFCTIHAGQTGTITVTK